MLIVLNEALNHTFQQNEAFFLQPVIGYHMVSFLLRWKTGWFEVVYIILHSGLSGMKSEVQPLKLHVG
jgi:hypothetical protein